MPVNRYFVPIVCLAALLLTGCTPHSAPEKAQSAIPQRIISVVPSATEMLFAFGLADRIIAVGDYDQFPPEARSKPKVGALLNPNIEAIIEFKPDFVVTYGSQSHDILRERMKELGIRIYPIASGNIEETLGAMLELGRAVGAEDKAREVERHIRDAFDDIRAHAPAHHPKVLLVHSRGTGALGSFYSVGSKAFQSQLIDIAGGVNLFQDVDKEVLEPSLESIIERGPEIIIETLSSSLTESEAKQRTLDWNVLPKLPAVANHRVYIVGEDYMLIPGPRLDLAARKVAAFIRAGQ